MSGKTIALVVLLAFLVGTFRVNADAPGIISPDGKLSVAVEGPSIVIRDRASAQIIFSTSAEGQSTPLLVFDPDSTRLYFSIIGGVDVWNRETNADSMFLNEFWTDAAFSINGLGQTYSPDHRYMVMVGIDAGKSSPDYTAVKFALVDLSKGITIPLAGIKQAFYIAMGPQYNAYPSQLTFSKDSKTLRIGLNSVCQTDPAWFGFFGECSAVFDVKNGSALVAF